MKKPNQYIIETLALEDVNNWEGYKEELEEVLAWQEKDVLKVFEGFKEHSPKLEQLADLDFMCQDINSCNSFKCFGISCSCMRENFSNPELQQEFAEKYLELTKQELLEIVRGNK